MLWGFFQPPLTNAGCGFMLNLSFGRIMKLNLDTITIKREAYGFEEFDLFDFFHNHFFNFISSTSKVS